MTLHFINLDVVRTLGNLSVVAFHSFLYWGRISNLEKGLDVRAWILYQTCIHKYPSMDIHYQWICLLVPHCVCINSFLLFKLLYSWSRKTPSWRFYHWGTSELMHCSSCLASWHPTPWYHFWRGQQLEGPKRPKQSWYATTGTRKYLIFNYTTCLLKYLWWLASCFDAEVDGHEY